MLFSSYIKPPFIYLYFPSQKPEVFDSFLKWSWAISSQRFIKVFQTFPWALADFHLVQYFFLTIFNNFVFVCLFVKPIYSIK